MYLIKKNTFIAVSLIVVGLALMLMQNHSDSHRLLASADIINTNGRTIGEVDILSHNEDGHKALEIQATIKGGLTQGFHGFHIHEVGLCEYDSDAPFTSAGGHFDPDGTVHGHHAGDLPSLLATENGSATLSYHTDAFSVRELLAGDGTAFIIHAGADNFANIPERYGGPDKTTLSNGDAGARVACGVIVANK